MDLDALRTARGNDAKSSAVSSFESSPTSPTCQPAQPARSLSNCLEAVCAEPIDGSDRLLPAAGGLGCLAHAADTAAFSLVPTLSQGCNERLAKVEQVPGWSQSVHLHAKLRSAPLGSTAPAVQLSKVPTDGTRGCLAAVPFESGTMTHGSNAAADVIQTTYAGAGRNDKSRALATSRKALMQSNSLYSIPTSLVWNEPIPMTSRSSSSTELRSPCGQQERQLERGVSSARQQTVARAITGHKSRTGLRQSPFHGRTFASNSFAGPHGVGRGAMEVQAARNLNCGPGHQTMPDVQAQQATSARLSSENRASRKVMAVQADRAERAAEWLRPWTQANHSCCISCFCLKYPQVYLHTNLPDYFLST